VTFRSAEGGAWAARACLQRRKTRRVATRGREAGSGTGGGGCRSERRSRSSGCRRKLRWLETTRLFTAEKMGCVAARGREAGSGTGGGGCRSERRSSGRRRKLRWPETAAGGEQWWTTAKQWQTVTVF